MKIRMNHVVVKDAYDSAVIKVRVTGMYQCLCCRKYPMVEHFVSITKIVNSRFGAFKALRLEFKVLKKDALKEIHRLVQRPHEPITLH